MGAGQALYGPALPIYALAFGISPATAGLLISAHWVGALAAVAGIILQLRRVSSRMCRFVALSSTTSTSNT